MKLLAHHELAGFGGLGEGLLIRWWYPGTREGDAEPPPPRLPAQFDTGFRTHNTNVFPERPNCAFVGYADGGALVFDIADMRNIKVVPKWNHSPPF